MEDSALGATVRFEGSPAKSGHGGATSRASEMSHSRHDEMSPVSTAETGFGAADVTAASGFPGSDMESTAQGTFYGRGSTAASDKTVVVRSQKPKGEPRPGMQDLVRIKSVFDIYKAVRILVGMVANTWAGANGTLAAFRQILPGLARVHCGKDKFVVPGFLLQDLEPMLQRSSPKKEYHNPDHTTVTDPTVVDVHVKMHTPFFKHVLLLLKLRWLLRLHSACCELDYKMCSCSNLIKGLQYVALQQYAQTEADSGFDSKVSQHIGSHVNMESVVNDIFDQLQRALGGGWRAFLEYVGTCDPTRSVHASKMDIAPAPIVPNDALMTVVDTIFVTSFLRTPRGIPASDLKTLYSHIEMLGLPPPELPNLKRAQNLRMWAKARTKPTKQDRDRANKKDIDKLAQLDAVLLCAALELKLPEIMATQDEVAEMSVTTSLPKNMVGDVAPEPVDFGSTGKGDFGPPAARVMMIDKPQLSPLLFNAVVNCIHAHMTFPAGVRERMYSLMVEEYGLTREQSERLAIAVTQNIDGNRLPNEVLFAMEEREKVRLRNYEVQTYKDCSHLLKPALVAAPEMKSKPSKYTWNVPVPARGPFASAFSSSDMTRSLPELRGFTASRRDGREEFKVPLSTGPLTMDPDLHKLRTTGFFIKMPPLKYT